MGKLFDVIVKFVNLLFVLFIGGFFCMEGLGMVKFLLVKIK